MQPVLVETTNITKLNAAIFDCAERKWAREVCMILVEGAAGLGKSLTLQYLHSKMGSDQTVLVRARPWWTPARMLRDIAEQMNTSATYKVDHLFSAVTETIIAGERIVFVDEFQDAAQSTALLETLRAVSDETGCVMVLAGGPGCEAMLQRHPQFASRLAEVIRYGALPASDIRLIADSCLDDGMEISDEAIAEITTRSRGIPRAALRLLARAERAARSAKTQRIEITHAGEPGVAAQISRGAPRRAAGRA